jgi:bacterioferritin-associated ferredoxin
VSEELRVEFKLAIARRPEPKPKPELGVKAERLRVDRAARRARNLALAHYIDHLIRSGEVADLAGVARMCGVSRARVSQVVAAKRMANSSIERLLLQPGD